MVVAVFSITHIIAIVAMNHVPSQPSEEPVRTRSTGDVVNVGTADDEVVATVAVERVDAGAARNEVIPVESADDVVATAAEDAVSARMGKFS
ncbi:MAG TPA: hypothetical protein VFN67_35245 [Polyangiales bacterium]|nr:hypothetical protein [Polyangiales bacterium]